MPVIITYKTEGVDVFFWLSDNAKDYQDSKNRVKHRQIDIPVNIIDMPLYSKKKKLFYIKKDITIIGIWSSKNRAKAFCKKNNVKLGYNRYILKPLKNITN